MSIHWDALLAVFVVSLTSAVAVVVLVALGLVGLSARAAVPDGPVRSRAAGTVAAGTCLVLAAAIVLAGLWVIVAG
jgi:hypothetical protein